MSLVVPDVGNIALLNHLLNRPGFALGPLSLRLYTNDYTPDRDSITGDFSEASFLGYFRKTISGDHWSSPAVVGERVQSEWTDTEIPWSNRSAEVTVYGYYVVNPVTEATLWAERADTPQVVPTDGTIALILRFTGKSEFV